MAAYTKERAAREGFRFTGIYSSDREEVKRRLEEMRAKYPQAKFVFVNVPPNPLSRGHHGMGYEVQGNEVYRYLDAVDATQKQIANYDTSAAYIKGEYDKAMAKLNETTTAARVQLEVFKAKLAELGVVGVVLP